jgi:hypothetical protein
MAIATVSCRKAPNSGGLWKRGARRKKKEERRERKDYRVVGMMGMIGMIETIREDREDRKEKITSSFCKAPISGGISVILFSWSQRETKSINGIKRGREGKVKGKNLKNRTNKQTNKWK